MELDLSAKKLTALPAGLDLSQITDLRLWDNKFAVIPAPVLALTQLRVLNFGNNPLTSLPRELTALKNLESLTLYLCPITSFPDWLAELPKLAFLWISNHEGLSCLSPKIGEMASLTRLRIDSEYTGNALGKFLERMERVIGQMNPTGVSDFTLQYVRNPQEALDALDTLEFGPADFRQRVITVFSEKESREKLTALKVAVDAFIEAQDFFADRSYEAGHEAELKAQLPARRQLLAEALEASQQDLADAFPGAVAAASYDPAGRFRPECLEHPRGSPTACDPSWRKRFGYWKDGNPDAPSSALIPFTALTGAEFLGTGPKIGIAWKTLPRMDSNHEKRIQRPL